MSKLKLYLAGPDVFLPDAVEVLAAKQAICAEAGMVGVSPLDGPRPDGPIGIFAKCEAAMDISDVMLANMTPFRGPGMDAGTAYEVGYMRARGKPVFAYSNHPAAYAERVPDARKGPDGDLIDGFGQSVEDFGLPENLMLAGAAQIAGPGILTPAEAPSDPLRDLGAFARLVAIVRDWSNAS